MLMISILRVLGLILLAVLLLLLVCLLYLLCSPICYQVQGRCEDAPGVFRGSVTGMLRFVQLRATYTQGRLQWSLSLFWGGLQILPRKNPADGASEEQAERREEQNAQSAERDLKEGARAAEQEAAEVLTDPMRDDGSKKEPPEKKQKKKKQDANDEKEQPSVSPLDRLAGLWDNISHPDFREAVSFLWKKVVWLFRKFSPKRISCDCSFSLGDPALTGHLTGLLALCPACYGKRVTILPDFSSEDIFFHGWIVVSGRVHLIHAVYAAAAIFLHENCRKLFHIS